MLDILNTMNENNIYNNNILSKMYSTMESLRMKYNILLSKECKRVCRLLLENKYYKDNINITFKSNPEDIYVNPKNEDNEDYETYGNINKVDGLKDDYCLHIEVIENNFVMKDGINARASINIYDNKIELFCFNVYKSCPWDSYRYFDMKVRTIIVQVLSTIDNNLFKNLLKERDDCIFKINKISEMMSKINKYISGKI